MERYKQTMIRKWVNRTDESDKDIALTRLLDYLIDNGLMQIDSEDEDPYWMIGDFEALI